MAAQQVRRSVLIDAAPQEVRRWRLGRFMVPVFAKLAAPRIIDGFLQQLKGRAQSSRSR